jgi:hypothetical protein
VRYILNAICPLGVVVGFISYRILRSEIYRNQRLIISHERSEYIAELEEVWIVGLFVLIPILVRIEKSC